MEIDQKLFEQVTQYLNDRLSPEERKAFEERYQNDPDFAEKVVQYKETILVAEQAAVEQMMQSFYEQEYVSVKNQGKAKTRSLWQYSLAAAVLLLLFSLPLYFLFLRNTDHRLFEAYFEPYPFKEKLFIRSEEPVGKELQKAGLQYIQKDYEGALALLKKSKAAVPQKQSIYLYIGICHLQLEEPQQAIAALQEVLKDSESALLPEAEWYLALAYLKNKERDKALAQLEKIHMDPDSDRKEEAGELLQKLNK